MEPRWDNLPYPVIHTIAKEDLQIIIYAQHYLSNILYRSAYLDKGSTVNSLRQWPIVNDHFVKINLLNLVKHLNNKWFPNYDEIWNPKHDEWHYNFEEYKWGDGLLMRQKLALNRHWYGVLLDYSPTNLLIDSTYLRQYLRRRRGEDDKAIVEKLVQSLQQVNLSKLKHFKFKNKIENVILHKERFDVLFFKDKYYDNSDFDKSHFGHFFVGNPHFPFINQKILPFRPKNYQSLLILSETWDE